MYYQILSKPNEYRSSINDGMAVYQNEKIRIEFLTLSISKEDRTDIMVYFEKLIPELLYKKRFGYVDFCGVVVDHQHLHFFIRKPFVRIEQLRTSWQIITGKESNVMIKTIKFDMDGVFLYTKALSYTMTQNDHHDGLPFIFVRSPHWGIVLHKKREKKNLVKDSKSWMKNKGHREETFMIDGKFVTEKEFNDYLKTKSLSSQVDSSIHP